MSTIVGMLVAMRVDLQPIRVTSAVARFSWPLLQDAHQRMVVSLIIGDTLSWQEELAWRYGLRGDQQMKGY